MSRLTPSEKLPARTMAMRSEARRSVASSSSVQPVEPTTSAGPSRLAQSSASSAEAMAEVKSMMTRARSTTTSRGDSATHAAEAPGYADVERSIHVADTLSRLASAPPPQASSHPASGWKKRWTLVEAISLAWKLRLQNSQ